MARTIWKFPIPVADEVSTTMPEGAEVIHVGTQHGSVCLWAIVAPEAPLVERHFSIHGTGHPLRRVGEHIGSCFQGPFVWHVFERASTEEDPDG